ncbi:PASTA domain, binds beta-lactams [Ekhidna lutea]|uniref:PASTA domain, binds beta-lactams n=1 Tax=Ekhidna lutea TaxID=447679 RepID=A0A239HZA5_EKHLU|nr:PASTA domain-containing protein [Ekhidna lutea]SNS86571.1 PASTA domain, binds beta-lactams [Ekhidna lutea]
MSFRKPTSVKDFLIHLGVLIGSGILIVIVVFYIWLPITTNHGETITVPDIQGMTVSELDDFLSKRNLRYEATADSSYSPDHPPLAVLRQVPKPNTKVKENRKIYVTLNAESPPKVRMPRVEDLSLRAAMMVLKSYDLKLGDVRYVPDVFFGVVHEAKMNGRAVLEGEKIEKGSLIDLIVGDGYGNTVFQSPLLIGLDQEEAETAIIGSGLKVGKIQTTEKSLAGFDALDSLGNDILEYRSISPGTVQQQYPRPGRRVKIGDPVDIWIYQPDTVSNTSTILDNQ